MIAGGAVVSDPAVGNLGVRELDEGGQELAAASKAGGECESAPGGPNEA